MTRILTHPARLPAGRFRLNRKSPQSRGLLVAIRGDGTFDVGGAHTFDVVSGNPVRTRLTDAANTKQNVPSPLGRYAIFSDYTASGDGFRHEMLQFSATDPWSLSCWLWMEGQLDRGGQIWFGRDDVNTDWIQFLDIPNNLCRVEMRGLGSALQTIRFVNGFAGERRWWHVVLTYDGVNTIAGWGDGFPAQQLNSYTDSMDFNSIGKPWNNGRYANGSFDDYRIYDYALSAAEVRAIYENGNDLYQRPVEYFLLPSGPAPPTNNGDGTLVQSAQQISGSGTVTPPPTKTGSGALVQSAQQIAGAGFVVDAWTGTATLVQTPQEISGSGIHAAVIAGTAALVQADQQIAGVGIVKGLFGGDSALIQSAQQIAGAGNKVSPGAKAGAGDLVQTNQLIVGIGTRVSAPRIGSGALVQSQQLIVGRGFGEGFEQPLTDQVYTMQDLHLYTITDRYVYT